MALSLAQIEALVGQVAGADPDVLLPVISGFGDSSRTAMEMWTRARDVDQQTAQAFLSAGREVYDAAAATEATRRRLGDAGEAYRTISDAARVVHEELVDTQSGVTTAWGSLNAEISGIAAAETLLAQQAPMMTQPEVDDRARVLRDRYDYALEIHGGRISRLIEGYTDVLVNRGRVLAEVAETIGDADPAVPAGDPLAPAPPPPAGGDPAAVNAWWDGLSLQQQDQLITTDPGLVGNLDGVPVIARDQANRAVLDASIARYEGLQRDAQARVDSHGEVPDWLPDVLPPLARVERDSAELADLTGRLDGLRAIQARLDDPAGGPPAYLVGLRPDTESGGQAIVALGNPDTADNVATFVPGTFAAIGNADGNIGGYIADTGRLVQSARDAAPAEETAVITWVGYDAPQSLFPQAADESYADEAQPALRQFQDGLRATHEGAPSFNTVAGHSYGTTVIGHTARDGELDADRIAFAGSPGTGVDHVSELRRPPGTVYSTTSESDEIGITNLRVPVPFTEDGVDVGHDRDPSSPEYGAHVYQADPDGDHGAYFRENNPALTTLGQIIVGNDIP